MNTENVREQCAGHCSRCHARGIRHCRWALTRPFSSRANEGSEVTELVSRKLRYLQLESVFFSPLVFFWVGVGDGDGCI